MNQWRIARVTIPTNTDAYFSWHISERDTLTFLRAFQDAIFQVAMEFLGVSFWLVWLSLPCLCHLLPPLLSVSFLCSTNFNLMMVKFHYYKKHMTSWNIKFKIIFFFVLLKANIFWGSILQWSIHIEWQM